MKKIFKILSDFFKSKLSPQSPPKPTRRYVKDVKPGETIQIEWYRILGGIGKIDCLNNDPITKKILLQVHWKNHEQNNVPEYEKLILDYDSKELANFHLINQLPIDKQKSENEGNDYDIATLQKQMNDALSKEDYETADKLQKKIDKLLKK